MLRFHASAINHRERDTRTSQLRSLCGCRSKMANNIATEQKQAGNEAARAVKVAVVSRLQAMVSTHGRRLINPRFKNFSTPRTRISLLASLQTRYPSPSILGWLIVHKRLETIRQRRNLRSTRVCVQPPWFSPPSLFYLISYLLVLKFKKFIGQS